jgi:RNA polymerase sigma-70 factor (ECF subfamily)
MSELGADPAKFVQHFVRHQQELLGYVLPIVGSLSDAQDVLQEAALEIWRCWDRYDPERPFVSWAKGVLRNKALMFLRTRKRFVFLSDELAYSLFEQMDRRHTDREQRARALDLCLEQLRAQDRDLLRHRYHEQGHSLRTLAEQQCRSANSLYKSLGRIRRQLRECIDRRLVAGENA